MSCERLVSTSLVLTVNAKCLNVQGVHVLLGPTVNTQRSPLGGRGFESFSEDPHLNGTIAGAYINALQSRGVAATLKHYVTNDQEFERLVASLKPDSGDLRVLNRVLWSGFRPAAK